MGDYANDYIDNCVTEYFESNSNCFDNSSTSFSSFSRVKTNSMEDYSKCTEEQLKKLKNYPCGILFRNEKVSINAIVHVLKETEKAILFTSEEMVSPFWCPKSLLYKNKKETEKFPDNQIVYTPNWFIPTATK